MKKELAEELDGKLQAARSQHGEGPGVCPGQPREAEGRLTLASLDSQVQTLSGSIVQKLIPFKA